ncbi:hypothetical protein RHODGE_RHODGE_02825 [Rhodoplanes serenus]|uniref:Uncharacterized protein n=1 Tax=Rhodoplanes serenus TaxID=200615 RepID=A0A3S4BX73_9BRAD|nr:hypothetical protein [Rhodoplanes serenus]VCU09656.1 hypothetical protein RHODGE_RHODGE_02825 [Rhodoplanes serenus]
MKMRAVDQLHISAVRPDVIAAGEEFEIEDGEGAKLASRGLARVIEVAEKAAPAPSNKSEPPPANKSEAAGAASAEHTQTQQADQPTRGKRGNKH